jgi:hypothetical protein
MKSLLPEGRASARPALEQRLTAPESRWRVTSLALLSAALCAVALVPPGSLPRWLPLPTSCGAITGLPCIFCGTTRALYHLLHAEFGRAFYYNWLAFPLLAAALALSAVNAFELLLGRDLLVRAPRIRLTRVSFGGLAAALVLLWCLQVYLAVSQHKAELLNPNGPLYSLVVR